MAKQAVDHLGKEYPSISVMCAEYGTNIHRYSDRISNGWSVEDALTKRKDPVVDHLGNEFKTQDEMCAAHGVKVDNFRRRIKRGLSLSEALSPEKINPRDDAWTDKEDKFIRKNIHLTNAAIAAGLNGRTQAAVEDRVRKLGLARVFQKHEVETLKRMWNKGLARRSIERALPRFTWRQISKKANNEGLPPLNDMKEAVQLYTLLRAMGEGSSTGDKWRAAGLRVTDDSGLKMKNTILLVDIDEFWDFAAEHPDIVDIKKLFSQEVEDVLGVPSDEILSLKRTAEPVKKRVKHKVVRGKRREELAKVFYETSISTQALADRYGVTVDTVRHAACQHKQEGHVRNTKSVVTDEFLRKLHKLFYVEGLTYKECAAALYCSVSSVGRGIKILMQKGSK